MTMSKLTLVFAAVAVLMLNDLCSASENLPGQDLGEIKRSWFPEEDKRASWYPLFHKRSDDNSWMYFYKRNVGTPYHIIKRSGDNPWTRPAGIFMLGKRSWFPEEDKRALWYPYKRSDDNSWTHDFYKRNVGTPYHIIKRSGDNPWLRPTGLLHLGKRSFFPADYFNKRDNPWLRPTGLLNLGKRSWFPEEDKRAEPFNADVIDKRAGLF